MNAQKAIMEALSGGPRCDDCLALMLGLARPHVNQRCNYLSGAQFTLREKVNCPNCNGYKYVNRASDEGLIRWGKRLAREITVTIDPTKIKPITEEEIRENILSVGFRRISERPIEQPPWFWEGHVQACIVNYLSSQGYKVVRTADTRAKTSGKDVEALSSDGNRLLISVKGFPEKSSYTQARHWFAEGLFDLILYREEDAIAELGLGLPSGFATYINLSCRVTWIKKTLPFKFYWVERDGEVTVD